MSKRTSPRSSKGSAKSSPRRSQSPNATDEVQVTSSEWMTFVEDVGLPENPYAVPDENLFDGEHGVTAPTQFTNEQRDWVEEGQHPTAECEKSYKKRDLKKDLTKLQYEILVRAMGRSGYTATPINKLTYQGVIDAIKAHATPGELKAFQDEQDGITEPEWTEVINDADPIVISDYDDDDELPDDAAVVPDSDEEKAIDADDDFFEGQQKNISPERFDHEQAVNAAADDNDPSLRKERRTACVPCSDASKGCKYHDNTMNKQLHPDLICDRCRANHPNHNGLQWNSAFCTFGESAAYVAYRGPPGEKKVNRARHRTKIREGKAPKGSRPYNEGAKKDAKKGAEKRKAEVLEEVAEESDEETDAPEDDDAGEGPSNKRTKRQ